MATLIRPRRLPNPTSIGGESIRPMQNDLVRRAQRGDRVAFRSARARAAERALRVGQADRPGHGPRRGRRPGRPARGWRDLRGLREPDRLDAWLHRLLVRACHRAAQKHRRLRIAELPIAFDHDAVAPNDIEWVLTRSDLDRAFGHLPLHHRTILVLAYYADLSTVDVAAALNIPVGTVKSRLSRATAAFRAAVAAEERGAQRRGGIA